MENIKLTVAEKKLLSGRHGHRSKMSSTLLGSSSCCMLLHTSRSVLK